MMWCVKRTGNKCGQTADHSLLIWHGRLKSSENKWRSCQMDGQVSEAPMADASSPLCHVEVLEVLEDICPLWLSTNKNTFESNQTFACFFTVPGKLLMSPRLPSPSYLFRFSSISIGTITPCYPNYTAFPMWYSILYDLSTSHLHLIWSF